MMKLVLPIFLSTLLIGMNSLHAYNESAIQQIRAENAPIPVGNYSHAMSIDLQKTKNIVFLSGQVAINPKTGELMEEDIATATNQVLDNLEVILKAAGSGWEYVARVDVFLRDFNDWDGMNAEYAKRFPKGVFPARQTVGVRLDHRIEISCIAVVPLNER
jgi:2-iminobutanoate/2-iminopropanoate deaminase